MEKNKSFETEEQLIGLLIKERMLIVEADALLEPNVFTDAKTISVYSALILNKSKLDDNVFNDIQIAEEALNIFETNINLTNPQFPEVDFKKSECTRWGLKDWHDYLSYLVYSAGFKSLFDEYIKILLEKKRRRTFSNILYSTLNSSQDSFSSSKELVSTLQGKLLDLTKDIEIKDFKDIRTFSEDFYNKLVSQTINNRSIKTHLKNLDIVLNGFGRGDLIIIAARPSMGKTAFALQLAFNVAREKNVAFFSIEMPNEQILQRLIAMRSGTFLNRIKNFNKLTSQQKRGIEVAIEEIQGYNLWLDDTPGIRINELIWKARKLHSINKLDLIIVDYLQLIESTTNIENRVQQVSEISRSLKALARELDVPLVALSQLSRKVEQREDKRPIMSDIRESGSIEQDADLIMFLFRENYYKTKKEVSQNFEEQESIEIIISKHRNGPTGMVKLGFTPTIGKFEDISET